MKRATSGGHWRIGTLKTTWNTRQCDIGTVWKTVTQSDHWKDVTLKRHDDKWDIGTMGQRKATFLLGHWTHNFIAQVIFSI